MKYRIIFILLSFFLNSIVQARLLNESLIILKKKSLHYGNIQTTKSFERKGLRKTFLNVNFEFNKALCKLEVVFPLTEKEFQSEKNNVSTVIKQSYEDQPTPYAGEITNTAKCSSMFKPIFLEEQVDSKKIYILKTLTGKDLSYGLCDKKSIVYSECTTFYYDQLTSQFFKINIYVNPALSCEKLTKNLIQSFTNI
ncbi:MAG: hypothetical protein PHY93_12885 [Bacteriovorax sp.]|nr:hypothetical protein [Bacteriovorax sp.]